MHAYSPHRYVKFKQGEIWVAIASNFEASGIRPTAPDRERLTSGIELSEHLATAVSCGLKLKGSPVSWGQPRRARGHAYGTAPDSLPGAV
eukprot:803311-Pelagomonas_calceolata.AAC.1